MQLKLTGNSVAFVITMTIILSVAYGVFWVWDQDVKRDEHLQKVIVHFGDGDMLQCGILEHTSNLTNGGNVYQCEGATLITKEVVVNEKTS